MRTLSPRRVVFDSWVEWVRRLVVDPARGTLEGPRVFRKVDPQEQAKDGREFTRGEYHASRLRR